MLTFKLAIRGLWRHRLRTLVTLAAIACGYFLMMVFMGISEGSHGQMIDLGVRQGTAGHVVVQAEGYQKEKALELLLPKPEEIRSRIEKSQSNATVTLRVYGGGLAKSASNAVGVMFSGVEPKSEKKVSDLPNRIKKGVYLGVTPRSKKGKDDPLWCARPPAAKRGVRQVVIGKQLARTLKLGLCDKLILDVQGMAELESAQLRVVGIFETGNDDIDGFFLHLVLSDAQRLLHVGKRVHQVAVFLPSWEMATAVAATLRREVAGPGRVVLPWDQAIPELAEFIMLDDASLYVFIAIVFVIVGIGVLNTVLMSVIERTREFGLIRALGAGPVRVISIVLMEAALIGAIGLAIGAAAGLPFNHYLETTGFDINQLTEGGMRGAGVAMTGIVRSNLRPSSAMMATLSVFGMAVVSALYPAIRAARLKVLEAIHDV